MTRKSVYIFTGPPASGKTTLLPVARDVLSSHHAGSLCNIASEDIFRIQADALASCMPDPPFTYNGPQINAKEEYRKVLTDAAIRGLGSFASLLYAQSLLVVLETPESGLEIILDALDQGQVPDSEIVVLWLTATLETRIVRNNQRDMALRLSEEAMVFFEGEHNRLRRDLYSSLQYDVVHIDTNRPLETTRRLIEFELSKPLWLDIQEP